jgi:hypothetical protein
VNVFQGSPALAYRSSRIGAPKYLEIEFFQSESFPDRLQNSRVLLTAANAQSHTPKDGFVPDSTTAIKVAEALLIPAFGKDKIESERPFKATLDNGV